MRREKEKENLCAPHCQAALLVRSQLTPEGIRALRGNKSLHVFIGWLRYLVATANLNASVSSMPKAIQRFQDRTYSLNDDTSDLVRASIAGGAAVLEVTLAILSHLARNTNATTTVGNTVAELINAAGLVAASETLLVTLTVDSNVLNVTGLELLHVSLNGLHTTLSTSGDGGDVAVETSSVPFTLDGLGVEGDTNAELFSDTVEEETGHPKLVAH